MKHDKFIKWRWYRGPVRPPHSWTCLFSRLIVKEHRPKEEVFMSQYSIQLSNFRPNQNLSFSYEIVDEAGNLVCTFQGNRKEDRLIDSQTGQVLAQIQREKKGLDKPIYHILMANGYQFDLLVTGRTRLELGNSVLGLTGNLFKMNFQIFNGQEMVSYVGTSVNLLKTSYLINVLNEAYRDVTLTDPCHHNANGHHRRL